MVNVLKKLKRFAGADLGLVGRVLVAVSNKRTLKALRAWAHCSGNDAFQILALCGIRVEVSGRRVKVRDSAGTINFVDDLWYSGLHYALLPFIKTTGLELGLPTAPSRALQRYGYTQGTPGLFLARLRETGEYNLSEKKFKLLGSEVVRRQLVYTAAPTSKTKLSYHKRINVASFLMSDVTPEYVRRVFTETFEQTTLSEVQCRVDRHRYRAYVTRPMLDPGPDFESAWVALSKVLEGKRHEFLGYVARAHSTVHPKLLSSRNVRFKETDLKCAKIRA